MRVDLRGLSLRAREVPAGSNGFESSDGAHPQLHHEHLAEARRDRSDAMRLVRHEEQRVAPFEGRMRLELAIHLRHAMVCAEHTSVDMSIVDEITSVSTHATATAGLACDVHARRD